MNSKSDTNSLRIQRQSGAMSTPSVVVLLVIVVVALIAAYFWFSRSPTPPPIVDSGIYAPVTTPEERGDSARDLIEEIKSNPAGVEYADAYEQARQYQADSRFADAQLLYFFAARGNYAPAAFELATIYDPLHFSSENSLMDEANATQAFKWYKQARDGGNEMAAARLEALKAWVENAASDGDPEAERLLLRWE